MTLTNRGLFIVFEGIDASGKSTQVKALAHSLELEGHNVHVTAEPTSGPIGSLIRQAFSGRLTMDDRAIAALFVADRIDHLTNERDGLLALLEAGVTVISDRYYLSSLAYHSSDVGMAWVLEANSISTDLLRPDLTIYLDISPSVAAQRLEVRQGLTDKFEVTDRLAVAHSGYEEALTLVDGVEKVARIAAEIGTEALIIEVRDAVRILFEQPGAFTSLIEESPVHIRTMSK